MKILWVDDQSGDTHALQAMELEWRVRAGDLLTAKDFEGALRALKKHGTAIELVVLDLYWPGEDERTAEPMGIKFLRELRAEYPALRIATRSKVDSPAVLMRFLHEFLKHRVRDHFVVSDTDNEERRFRRDLLLREVAQGGERRASLSSYTGDRWGAVLFADISGFTTATEALWETERTLLVNTLQRFYRSAASSVTERHGVVDKLIGDEVMGVFVADGPHRSHRQKVAARAVEAAVSIVNNFRTLEHEFRVRRAAIELDSAGDLSWKLKIGIEGGTLAISREELPGGEVEYCTIGRAVNIASRIKGHFGDYSVTLGETLFGHLPSKGYETERSQAREQLKGLRREMYMYRLVL